MSYQGSVDAIKSGASNGLKYLKELLKNPVHRSNNGDKGAFVAFNEDNFSKTGMVPGYSDVSIHTQCS